MHLNSSIVKVALMDEFPDFNAPGFDINSYNQRFYKSNILIRANSRQIGFPKHWGGLSVKCASGGYEYYESGDDFYAVNASNYLIFNEGKNYSSFIDSKTTVESFTINFAPELERLAWHTISSPSVDLLDDPDKTSLARFRHTEGLTRHDNVISPLVYKLRDLSKDWAANHDAIGENLLLLLEAMILRDQATKSGEIIRAMKTSTRLELVKRLTRARDYLEANYDGDVSLSVLADVACMNVFYFLRQFKKLYRITPHQYLQQKRMTMALRMLRHDDLSVSEICNRVGFADPVSFGKLFVRYFDQTPGEFRLLYARSGRLIEGSNQNARKNTFTTI